MIGIGTDIIRVQRVAEVLERHGRRFAERILTRQELEVFQARKNAAGYLAKRFAAKEAASKALGTGIGRVSWQDFTVLNNADGAPRLELTGAALKLLHQRGGCRVMLSLADEKNYVVAFVVID